MSMNLTLPPYDASKIRQVQAQQAAQRDAATPPEKRNTATADQTNGGAVILGWLVIITLLAAVSRTRTGYVMMYYILWLGVLLLLLGSYQRLVPLIALVQAPGPASEGKS